MTFRRIGVAGVLILLLAAGHTRSLSTSSAQEPTRHDVTVTGTQHRFEPAHISVTTGDILRITLVADDSPYSFTIDAYRISKRATPGHPVTFEFRADRSGTFPYYCDLSTDEHCKDARGSLVVMRKD